MTRTNRFLNQNGSVNIAKASAAAHHERSIAIASGIRWMRKTLSNLFSLVGRMLPAR